MTVKTQPSGQTCVVHNGSGTIGTADISNVIVTCTLPGRLRLRGERDCEHHLRLLDRRLERGLDADRRLTVRLHRHDAGRGRGRSQRRLSVRREQRLERCVRVFDRRRAPALSAAVGEPVGLGQRTVRPCWSIPPTSSCYVANKTDNTVAVFATGSGGSLTAIGGSPFAVGDGAHLAQDRSGRQLSLRDRLRPEHRRGILDRARRRLRSPPSAARPSRRASGALSVAIDPDAAPSPTSRMRPGTRSRCTRSIPSTGALAGAVGLAAGHGRQRRIGGRRSRRQVPVRGHRRKRSLELCDHARERRVDARLDAPARARFR